MACICFNHRSALNAWLELGRSHWQRNVIEKNFMAPLVDDLAATRRRPLPASRHSATRLQDRAGPQMNL